MKQRCSHLDGFCKCYSDSINEGCAQTINPSWRPSEFWKPLWNFGNLSGFGSRLGGEQAHGGFKEESLGESELAPQHVSKPLKLRASDGTRYNMVYYGSTPTLGGVVTALTGQVVTIDTTITGASAPSNGDFILYVKNTVAESHGVMGHYCEYELTNTLTSKVELFSVGSESMKSFP